MSFISTVSLHASGAETTNGVGSIVDLGIAPHRKETALDLVLDITAIDGNLVVEIQTSADGLTGWAKVGGFDSAAEVSTAQEAFLDCRQFVRARWTLTGTTATFAVGGSAVEVYLTGADFYALGLPAKALEDVTAGSLLRAFKAATNRFDRSLIPAGYTLPLVTWGDDVSRDCAVLAAFDVLTTRGVDPDTIDSWIRLRYLELVGEAGRKGELDKIADGKLVPPGIVDSGETDTPTTGAARAAVVSQPYRGWSQR